MKHLLMAAAAATALSAGAYAQDLSPITNLPPSAQPGECFARIRTPAVVDQVPRDVIVQDAYETLDVRQAEFTNDTQEILIREAGVRYVVRQPRYETRTEQVMVRPAFERLTVNQPRFDNVTETITVGEPRLVWRPGRNLSGISRVDPHTGQIYCLVEEPGQTVSVSKRVLREPARVTATPVPPQFTTVTKQVLVDPGGVEEVPIPPEYRTLTVQRLARPAEAVPTMVPAQSRQIATNVVRAPERYEWVNVLCDTNATPQAISQLQSALQARGYYSGPIDGQLGSGTATALERYQRENGISHLGVITMDTLRSLGIGGAVPSSISSAPAPMTMASSSHSMSHSVVHSAPAQPMMHHQMHHQMHGAAPAGVTIHTPQTTQSAQVMEPVRDYSVRRQLTWTGK